MRQRLVPIKAQTIKAQNKAEGADSGIFSAACALFLFSFRGRAAVRLFAALLRQRRGLLHERLLRGGGLRDEGLRGGRRREGLRDGRGRELLIDGRRRRNERGSSRSAHP